MLRTLIRLSNGTEISSGSDASMNIRSCTITQCCNSGDELTIGSVCAACVEMVVETPANTFRAGDTFTLYKVDAAGNRTQIGIFNVFEPERKGDRLYKVTAYDNVIKLDKDLTEWILDNVAQYSDVRSFIDAVCVQCGIAPFNTHPQYNNDIHYIPCFEPTESVTGRKLMQWVGEMLGYFCIAMPNGELSLRWYRNSTSVILTSGTGNRFRLQGTYKRKNEILPVSSVVIRKSDGRGAGYSISGDTTNPYVIKDNPLLSTKDLSILYRVAVIIMQRLDADRGIFAGDSTDQLVACEVSTPASLDINVGDIIVVDEQENEEDDVHVPRNYMRIMTKIQKGQKDTLQCVGSYRRRN